MIHKVWFGPHQHPTRTSDVKVNHLVVWLLHFLIVLTPNIRHVKKWKLDSNPWYSSDIIILHICNKNWLGSWDTEWETEFFVILSHFLAFLNADYQYMIPFAKKYFWPQRSVQDAINEFSFWRRNCVFFLKILDFYVIYKSLNFKACGVLVELQYIKRHILFLFFEC